MNDWLIPDSFPKRFWAKVNKGGDDECWEWTASKNWGGYGTIQFDERVIKAHRASWILHNGPIPDDAHVLHHCDNPGCVNPKHLYIGNHNDNMRDMVARGRSAKGMRHSHAKLKDDEVLEIRQLFNQGFTYREISKKYGISRGHVGYALGNRGGWRHV